MVYGWSMGAMQAYRKRLPGIGSNDAVVGSAAARRTTVFIGVRADMPIPRTRRRVHRPSGARPAMGFGAGWAMSQEFTARNCGARSASVRRDYLVRNWEALRAAMRPTLAAQL
jgi:hypothetical protein